METKIEKMPTTGEKIRKPIKQNKKTKKIKKEKVKNLDNIWDSFDTMKDTSTPNQNDDEIECIYEKDNVVETNICKHCKSMLYVGDEGFLFVVIINVVFYTKIL